MRSIIRAVGHMKEGPEKNLVAQYQKRLHPAVIIEEYANSKEPHPEKAKADEGTRLLKDLPSNAACIALDEKGELWTSVEFAEILQSIKNKSFKQVVFFIGGAEGHGESILKASTYRFALGRLTWPHFLVRGLLLEQLYRAQQILANHPYHRD